MTKGPSVQTAPAALQIERLRCECGAVMTWRESLNASKGWKHKHVCIRPECLKHEWLDKKFPRLLVFDLDQYSTEPEMIIYPDKVGYS